MEKQLPRAEWIASLPTKRISASTLIRNDVGDILIVKPTYKDSWGLPGGSVEDGESPREGCIREVKEELGLSLNPSRLLCVDYRDSEGGVIQFLFDCGVIDENQISRVQLQIEELSEYKFVALEKAVADFLPPHLQKRLIEVAKILDGHSTLYLENGELSFI